MKEVSVLKTSALIDEDSYVFLDKIKKRIGREKFSTMINSIFMQVVIKYAKRKSPVIRKTVKYQEKNVYLKLFHYSIDSDLYEACLDARKVNKVTVSFLLNEAIRELISASLEKIELKCKDCFSKFIYIIKKLDSYQVIYSISLIYDGINIIQSAKTEIQMK